VRSIIQLKIFCYEIKGPFSSVVMREESTR